MCPHVDQATPFLRGCGQWLPGAFFGRLAPCADLLQYNRCPQYKPLTTLGRLVHLDNH